MKKIVYFLFILLICSYASAATIYGSIYDFSLKKVNNVVVEINTIPFQRYLAINGTYEFEIPIGSYQITTFSQKDNLLMTAQENLTIIDNGIYLLDLFLYPNLEEENDLFDDLEFDIEQPYSKEIQLWWFLIPLLIISWLFLFIIFRINKKIIKTEKEDEDLLKILLLLKKNNGRMTQLELRKHFPLSEAKISLMITELESLNKIKKIKKGRGNVIILNKR